MDTIKMIGTKITSQVRDAVHVAIISVGVKERVFPGQHVGMTNELADPGATRRVGIIDPFLPGSVFPGEQCLLFLYPGTITSLHHHWEHPEFPNDSKLMQIALQEKNRQIEDKWVKDETKHRLDKANMVPETVKQERDELATKLRKLEELIVMQREEAERYLQEIANEYGVGFRDMLDQLSTQGYYVQQGSTDMQSDFNYNPEKEAKVWAAVFALTGVRHSGSPFSCSC